jgi:ubiquitin C-terminal hydrolase
MSISEIAPQFSGFLQQDSHEWLTIFLNALHERMSRSTQIRQSSNLVKDSPHTSGAASNSVKPDGVFQEDAERFWSRYKRENDSAVAAMFHGLLLNTIQCPSCGFKRDSYEPFLTLSLPIPASARQILRRGKFPVVLLNGEFSYIELSEDSVYPWKYIGNLKKQIGDRLAEDMGKRQWLVVSLDKDYRATVLSDYLLFSLVDLKKLFIYECLNSPVFCIWLNFGVQLDAKRVSRIGVPRLLAASIIPESSKVLEALIRASLNFNEFEFILQVDSDDAALYPDSGLDFSAFSSAYSIPACLVLFHLAIPSQLAGYPHMAPSVLPVETQRPLTLYDCLVDFMKEEVLGEGNSWTCSRCLKPQRALKKISLCKIPESFLICHLKQYHSASQIAIPNPTLDLSSLIADDSGKSRWCLYGAVKHSGSLSFGHYTANILYQGSDSTGNCHSLEKGPSWFLMNDSFVSEVTGPPKEGHILFYKKVVI